MAAAKLRILTFSTLYPSGVRPGNGIFVETRLRELLRSGEVEARVVAPVPWFPFRHPRFGAYARMARTPRREAHNGVDVRHPRYFLPPKIGMSAAPILLFLGAVREVGRLLREGFEFDLIDAHYYYPDGVAAALLARRFGRPFVVTARGSDVNLIPRYRIPRRWIRWAAARAGASIAVSRALAERLAALGVDPARIVVLRNGVDLERFRPVDRGEARARLGLDEGTTLLSVGNLVEHKGHGLAIEALRRLPGFRLLIVGDGPDRRSLEALAARCGVADRVRFEGSVPQSELPRYYGAADLLVLASSREGWANVLLESMACGTPVVATAVGGSPEVVAAPEAGRLARERSPAAIADAIEALLARRPSPAVVRRYAERFDWGETTRGQLELFRTVVQGGALAPWAAATDAGPLRRS